MRSAVVPEPGETYLDYNASHLLTVVTVNPGDPLGREVVGTIQEQEEGRLIGEPRRYSTDLVNWEHRWLNERPPTPPNKQTWLLGG